MSTITQKSITAEQFVRMPNPPDGSRQELLRGEIENMPPPGFRHGIRRARMAAMIDGHARPRCLGRVTVEGGMITERDPDTVRGPDVAFWSFERLPANVEPEGYPEVAADLCVEVLSPGNTMRRILEKIREYFQRGVRMVWVVDPEDRTVRVYRSPSEARLLHDSATLLGEDVLPGFSCPVAELFD